MNHLVDIQWYRDKYSTSKSIDDSFSLFRLQLGGIDPCSGTLTWPLRMDLYLLIYATTDQNGFK